MPKLKDYLEALKRKQGTPSLDAKREEMAKQKSFERKTNIFQSKQWDERVAMKKMGDAGGEMPEKAKEAIESSNQRAYREVFRNQDQSPGRDPLRELSQAERDLDFKTKYEGFRATRAAEAAAGDAAALEAGMTVFRRLLPAAAFFVPQETVDDRHEQSELKKYIESLKE